MMKNKYITMSDKNSSSKTVQIILSPTTNEKNNSRQINEFLKESKEAFPNIINNIPQYVFWKDITGIIMGCNKKFSDLFHYRDPMDMIGLTDFDLFNPEEAKSSKEIEDQVIKSDSPTRYIRKYKDNDEQPPQWLYITKVPLHNDTQNIIGILGTIDNITEQVSTQEKLKKSEEKYRNLIEFTNTAYIILDDKLKILEANKVFINMISPKDENILGLNPRTWIHSKDVQIFDSSFEKLLRRGRAINDLQVSLIGENHKVIFTTINANILENGGIKIFCLISDVSHRKNLEEIKYIEEQKRKDKIIQNIRVLRNRLNKIKVGVD